MNSDLSTLLARNTDSFSSLERQQSNSLTESQLEGRDVSDEPPSPVSRKLPQYIAAITATLSALCAGVVLGWTSPILLELEHGHFHNITVNDNQMGWIGSFVTLGGMFMCIPTGFLCDLIGCKQTLLILIVPFSIGWLLIIFAKNVLMLYFGRFITGLAAGATCVAAPMYISETAEKERRGVLGSYFQLMITVGILFAYCFGQFLSPMNYTIFCALLPFIFFILFVFQPETPTYCLKKNMYDKALRALTCLRGPNWNNEDELSLIETELKDSLETTLSFSETVKKKANYKAFFIAMSLMFFQQFCGINAVILYTSDIFTSAGVNLDANIAAIIVGLFQVLATFMSSLYIDKLGRRILLISSSVVMGISTLILAVFFTLKFRTEIDQNVLKEIGFIPIVSLCLFIIMYSVGLGPVPWVMATEIFSSAVKSLAISVSGTFGWFLAFILTKFYLQINNLIGQDTTYYIFSIFSIVGGAFIYVYIPETKGKTIEQVQSELEA